MGGSGSNTSSGSQVFYGPAMTTSSSSGAGGSDAGTKDGG
jgi:hypothetical protein